MLKRKTTLIIIFIKAKASQILEAFAFLGWDRQRKDYQWTANSLMPSRPFDQYVKESSEENIVNRRSIMMDWLRPKAVQMWRTA